MTRPFMRALAPVDFADYALTVALASSERLPPAARRTMKTRMKLGLALGAVLLAGCATYPGGGYGDTGAYPGGAYPSYPPANYPPNGYPGNGYPGSPPPPGGYAGSGYGPVVR